MPKFTCAVCEVTYEKLNKYEWNDDKAWQEHALLFPEAKNDPVDVVCNVCFKEFMRWFSKLTDVEKRKMREENL